MTLRPHPDLIAEALVREIARASRWTAIREAWEALVRVRYVAEQLDKEAAHLSGAFAASAMPNVGATTPREGG